MIRMGSGLLLENDSPIAIGAIGGSGTRLLARIVERSGVFMGKSLNQSHDNLEFSKRFKQIDILNATDKEFTRRLQDFMQLMQADMAQAGASHWGWKEPNTHIVIARLLRVLPKMRYVHLLRSGLDMAFSRNQNQLRFWGPTVLKRPLEEPCLPADSLEYFCEIHRHVSALAVSPEGRERMIFVHFEDLCRWPEEQIRRLLEFLDLQTPDDDGMGELISMVAPPTTIGRWREHGTKFFRPEDLSYARSILPD